MRRERSKVKTMSKRQSRKQHGGVSLRWIRRAAWLVVCALGGLLGFSGMSLATSATKCILINGTPASGFCSNALGPTTFDQLHVVNAGDANVQIKTKEDVDVWIVTNTVSPGAHSGWHTHPGPSLVTVQSGTATYYDSDDPACAPHVVGKGEGFVDEGGDDHVHLVRNEGTEALVLIATQILPEGAPRRIDAPVAPLNCPAF
jgi:quercetin dioxygenase-like cupin family protein